MHQTSASTTRTAVVRFRPGEPEIASLVPPRSELSRIEKRRLWWNARDYSEFKVTAKVICREMRQYGSGSGVGGSGGYSGGLNAAYGRARHASDFVGSIVEGWRESDEREEGGEGGGESADDIEMAVARLRLDKGLVPWCTHGHSRRGLERWSSKSHGNARTADAESAKAAVVAASRRHARRSSRRSSGSAVVAQNEDEIGRVSRSSSRTARIFARMMGEADAFAAAANPTPLHARHGRLTGSPLMRRKSMPDMASFTSSEDATSPVSSASSRTTVEGGEASRDGGRQEATTTAMQPRRMSEILLPPHHRTSVGGSMRPLSGLVLSTVQ